MTAQDRVAFQQRRWLELALVVGLFGIPLFLGLGNSDLDGDEAIYSYAVDRIIETDDWLTPRSIPDDTPFLEKPPLKFWMIAAAIRGGIVPHNENGLRFFDALFGAIAFVYVVLFGQWLAGPGCGFVACLVLFTIDPLVFVHGLRSNNMEAALFLSYCGGLYHFARWVDARSWKSGRAHAFAVGGYFVLGFMTKFVAALFMPFVAALAFAWGRDTLDRIQSRWRDWVTPLLLVLGVVAPWFIYQTVTRGASVWQTMFGGHVYRRFTVGVDPGHIQPWYAYFAWTWQEFLLAGGLWIALIGIFVLAAKAWRGRPWLARLLLLWWAVPYTLLSLPPSKLFHYAYPFIPPLALGAGWVVVTVFRWLDRRLMAISSSALWRLRRSDRPPPPWRGVTSHVLFAAALLFLAVAVWTAITGPIRWHVDGWFVRNSSVVRPLLFSLVLLTLAGGQAIRQAIAIVLVGLSLPVTTYALQSKKLVTANEPLKVLSECALSTSALRESRVYMSYWNRLRNHTIYYYLRRVGQWRQSDEVDVDDLQRRLFSPAHQSLVVIAQEAYEPLTKQDGLVNGLVIPGGIFILTPGPLEICRSAAVAAGGTPLGG